MQNPKFKTQTVITGWRTDRYAVMVEMRNCTGAFLVEIKKTSGHVLGGKYVDTTDETSINEMVNFLISQIDDISNGGYDERREIYREMILTIADMRKTTPEKNKTREDKKKEIKRLTDAIIVENEKLKKEIEGLAEDNAGEDI